MTDPTARSATDQGVTHAIGLVLLAHLLFAMVDTSTKWLIGAGLTVLQLAFLRYAVHFVITLAEGTVRRQRVPVLTARVWCLVYLRAFCLVSATIANFVALGELPLAITSSILFLSPVLVCLFARVLLGEALTVQRLIAVAIGFTGALVILNPFGATVNWYAVLMLYPASAMALYIVLTRLLADQVSAFVLQFNTGLLGTIALTPLGIWAWSQPTSGLAWGLALSIGLLAWAGHEVLTRAHRHAEASLLAPYGYSFVVYLIITGWIVFGDVPTVLTLTGATFIVAAGLIVQQSRGHIARR